MGTVVDHVGLTMECHEISLISNKRRPLFTMTLASSLRTTFQTYVIFFGLDIDAYTRAARVLIGERIISSGLPVSKAIVAPIPSTSTNTLRCLFGKGRVVPFRSWQQNEMGWDYSRGGKARVIFLARALEEAMPTLKATMTITDE